MTIMQIYSVKLLSAKSLKMLKWFLNLKQENIPGT